MEEKKQQLHTAYEEHVDVIYRLCLYKTSNKEKAEDLTQDTFMRFWDYIAKGKKVKNTKSFLYQIARNLIIDHYRKGKTDSLDALQEGGFDPEHHGDEKIVQYAEKNIALEYIKKLDEKYQDVVYLRVVEELSMKEIGETLRITSNTATVRYHRGIKQLENMLQEK